MQLTIGETVLYTLSEDDVREINDPLDVTFSGGPGRRNPVLPGQTYPAVVVAADGPHANLRVLLDGYAMFWATSRVEGEGPGTWAWPPRVEA